MPGPVIIARLNPHEQAPGSQDKYDQGDVICVLPEGQTPGAIIQANALEKYAFVEVTDAGAGQAGVDAVIALGVLEPRFSYSMDPDGYNDEVDIILKRTKTAAVVKTWPTGQVNKAKDWNKKIQATLAQVAAFIEDKP